MPKKSTLIKRKVGRPPTPFLPEYCDKLIKHMAGGLSFETFAGTIDTCRDVLYRWEKKYDEFSNAKRKGLDQGQLFWEKAGRSIALGMPMNLNGMKIRPKDTNSSAWSLNMKNRFGWREKVEATGDTTVHHVIDIEDE